MSKIVLFLLLTFGISEAQIIDIHAPKENEKIKIGDTFIIKWNYPPSPDIASKKTVKISLIGENETSIADTSTLFEGFSWTLGTEIKVGKYKIKITNVTNALESGESKIFEIIPKEDVINKVGEKKSISEVFMAFYEKLEEYLRFKDSPNRSQNEIKKKEFEVRNIFFKDIIDLEEKIKSVSNKSEKEYYEKELKSLKDRFEKINTKTFVRISLIGDAGLLNSNSKDDKSFSGNGSIGIKFQSETRKFEAKALIVLLSNPDTIKVKYNSEGQIINFEDFGRSIVNPFSGTKSIQSGYLEFKEYFSKPVYGTNPNFGLAGYVGFSNRLWEFSDTDRTNPKTKQISTNILGASAGIFWDPFSKYLTPLSDLKLLISVSGTMRLLYGEIRGDEQFRKSVLGTDAKDFFGLELGFQLIYKGFQAYVTLPAIFSSSSVKGLTNGQYVGGISITTSIFDFEIFNEPDRK